MGVARAHCNRIGGRAKSTKCLWVTPGARENQRQSRNQPHRRQEMRPAIHRIRQHRSCPLPSWAIRAVGNDETIAYELRRNTDAPNPVVREFRAKEPHCYPQRCGLAITDHWKSAVQRLPLHLHQRQGFDRLVLRIRKRKRRFGGHYAQSASSSGEGASRASRNGNGMADGSVLCGGSVLDRHLAKPSGGAGFAVTLAPAARFPAALANPLAGLRRRLFCAPEAGPWFLRQLCGASNYRIHEPLDDLRRPVDDCSPFVARHHLVGHRQRAENMALAGRGVAPWRW